MGIPDLPRPRPGTVRQTIWRHNLENVYSTRFVTVIFFPSSRAGLNSIFYAALCASRSKKLATGRHYDLSLGDFSRFVKDDPQLHDAEVTFALADAAEIRRRLAQNDRLRVR
jgi:hypothetical protein